MKTRHLALLPALIAALLFAPAAASAEEAADSPTSGWFRVDTDGLGTQFWFGATHDVGGIALASDIYVAGAFAELDVGVAFSFGDLSLLPMAGIGFDFASQNAATIIAPQLFTIYDIDGIYFESWIQVFLHSPFDDTDTASDTFYTRNFLLYEVNDEFAVGPQADFTYQFSDPAESQSLILGGRVNVGYGENNTLGLFLGYDVEGADGSDKIGGRFTFLRTW